VYHLPAGKSWRLNDGYLARSRFRVIFADGTRFGDRKHNVQFGIYALVNGKLISSSCRAVE